MSATASFPVLDDYDGYAEVDQALLGQSTPTVLERPRVIEIDTGSADGIDAWSEAEAAALSEEIAALGAQIVICRLRDPEALGPWTDLLAGSTVIRSQVIVRPDGSGERLPRRNRVPGERIRLDLVGDDASSWPRWIRLRLGPWLEEPAPATRAVAPARDAIEVLLPWHAVRGGRLGPCLESLATLPCPPSLVTLHFDGRVVAGPDELREAAAHLQRHGSSFRVRGLNHYRLARLHLYYRLPLLRLVVEADRRVLPFPSSPLALGSLRESGLGDIWQACRGGFFSRPDIVSAFERLYRVADLAGRSS